jgi:uncharacterized protein YjgD (DUF1641 family)
MPLAKAAPQAVPDWALDFQRLNISAAPPQTQQPRNVPVPAAMSMASTMMSTAQSFAPEFESSFSYLGQGYGAGLGMGYMEHQDQGMGYMSQQPSFAGGGLTFDTEAFERAFDVAAAEASQLDTEAMQPESEYEALMRSDEELDQLMSSIQVSDVPAEATRVDVQSMVAPPPAVQEEAAKDEGMNENESDQLSRTAKQLLESVSHETSDKFAQSSFLELMRRLRDKEVHVEGEDFIEVCLPTSESYAKTNSRQPTTLQTPRAWPAPRSKSQRV